MGWQGAGRQLLGHSLLPLLGGRAAAAMVIGAVGAWSVLMRDRRSWKYAIIGGACGAGVMVIVGLLARRVFVAEQKFGARRFDVGG